MKLETFLRDQDHKRLIRIGCKNGSGFIYAGTVGDLDPDEVNLEIITRLKTRAKNNPKEEIKKTARRELREFVPIQRRNIVDQYGSCVGSTILIIDGTETDLGVGPGITDLSDGANPDAIHALTAAIVKQTAEDLRATHVKLREAQKTFLYEYQNAARLERWVRENAGHVIEDPDAIIDAIRKEVYGKTKC